MEILEFKNEYAFLSNFYPTRIFYNGMFFGSVEAAFQAQKVLDKEKRREFRSLNPSEAKHLGRRVALRPDWENVKDKIMYEILRVKFSKPEYMKKLLDTADARLVEGNTWHDCYWGYDLVKQKGQNKLGNMLMKIRDDYKKVHEEVPIWVFFN